MFNININKNACANYIPSETIITLAKNLGFEIKKNEIYTSMLVNDIATMTRDSQGEYHGILIQKPLNYSGIPLSDKDLDIEFVNECSEIKISYEGFYW